MTKKQKKQEILNCFIKHIKSWQRITTVAEELRNMFYDEKGNHTKDGEDLFNYL